ncbi:MAG TPA: SpoIID/LytB domain-containing protein [Phycisphaerae bacterium]|jgi:peptidoglycan hydrolase-like amidase
MLALRNWQLESREEPVIRVGIVLPEDRAARLELEAAKRDWVLTSADAHALPASGRLEFSAQGSVVYGRAGDAAIGAAPRWRISSSGALAGSSQILAGVAPLVRVRGVRTGRGFHWQKTTDIDLPGEFEVSAHDDRLILVNEVPVEAYLAGVITSEMSGACPLEFLKSQAITARSWLLARTEDKHRDLGIDYCNDDCCQRYQGLPELSDSARGAILATYGQVLVHESGVIVDANYSKSCGGIVESPEHVWGFAKPGQYAVADAPPGRATAGFFGDCNERLDEYLEGDWLAHCDAYCSPNTVPDADLGRYLGRVDDGCGRFRWSVEYGRAELEDILRAKYFDRVGPAEAAPLETLVDLIPRARGRSGRITSLAIRYFDPGKKARTSTIQDQYWIRHALSSSFLYSSAFAPEVVPGDDGRAARIRLVGAGWGHGAGLCQIGALGMALRGHSADVIMRQYFERSALRSLYDPP